MTTPSIHYDPTNPKDVYNLILASDPDLTTAKQFGPSLVEPYIPEGADPKHWCKVLRNYEYNLTHPKPERKRSAYCGRGNRKHNPAEAVVRRALTSALLGEV